MYKKRHIVNNKNGVSPVLEAIVAIGVSISLLIIFYISASNIYSTHDRPAVDVEAKCISVMEALLNSPGLGAGYDIAWEDNPENVNVVGLATTQTVAYGKANISGGEVTLISYYTFPDNRIGIADTCFLAGTKIVMADESYKNIEDITVGDMVKSFDEETGRIVNRRVTHVFHHTREETTKYYLVINNQLRVTPNHLVYSNGRWVYSGDLKTGSSLFYPCSNYKIYSIEKVFKREPTYDFEVEGIHNYFVALDTSDVLVHNAGYQYPPYDPQDEITPRFTWFDNDGPYRPGRNITFNAEDSTGEEPPLTFAWDFNGDGTWDKGPSGDYEITFNVMEDNNTYNVSLNVTDNNGHWDIVTHAVQANNPDLPEPDSKPWVLTGKDIYPNGTLAPYVKGYYVKFTLLNDGNYSFEIKEKTSPPYTILDYEKIKNINNVIYPIVKSALGLDISERVLYDFNITVSNNSGVILPGYGASYEHADILVPNVKDVLIYHKPTINESSGNIIEPYYEKGSITVRVFIGGIPPNYPPYEPCEPDPFNGHLSVRWDANLSWTCWDPDGDPVTFDIYFGTTNPPPKVESNQSAKSYDPPGIMNESKDYHWQIVAWDNHGHSTAGPIWSFTTKPNTPPNKPSNPSPADGATCVDVTTNLSWIGGDPDTYMGDIVTYKVYFGTTIMPPLKESGLQDTSYDPTPEEERLDYNTKYYWKIYANDSHGGSNWGDEWDFTTAEKGLDQHNSEGDGIGHNTSDYYMGQTFIAGRTGKLTKLKLSLKKVELFESGDLNLWVQIWKNPIDNPEDPKDPENILSNGNITMEDPDPDFKWYNLTLDQPVDVTAEDNYFIVFRNETSVFTYCSWQYSECSPFEMVPDGGGTCYDGGEAYRWEGRWEPFAHWPYQQDFLFKTYVFREPELDQYWLEHSDEGLETKVFNLAQTFTPGFTPGKTQDLMKVNLSLFSKEGAPNPPDITVKIYPGEPTPEWKEIDPLATTTIDGFIDVGSFVWKEANFSFNPPYLIVEELYSIVVTTEGDYIWEMMNEDVYERGDAWWSDDGIEWKLNDPLTDFIFATYMDEFG